MSWLYLRALGFHTFGINLPWMLFPGSAVNRLQPKDSCELHDIPLNLGRNTRIM